MHALIIEDLSLTAWLIEEELRELGYTSVVNAVTEEDAIAAARAQPPDLITSDGTLEKGSGVSAVLSIRASTNVPVVFITGDGEFVRRAIPGAIILEKPITHWQLADAVQRARMAVRP